MEETHEWDQESETCAAHGDHMAGLSLTYRCSQSLLKYYFLLQSQFSDLFRLVSLVGKYGRLGPSSVSKKLVRKRVRLSRLEVELQPHRTTGPQTLQRVLSEGAVEHTLSKA